MTAIVEAPAVVTPEDTATESEEQRVVLHAVDWAAYKAIGEALRDRPALRLTYDRGTLEIMTTSHAHEIYKKRLGRLLETLAEETGREILPAGSMTFQREDLKRALEPDECFWIQHEAEVRSRLEWDPAKDPPPDLVIEIEVSRSAVSRMGIYAALGVPEVWRYRRKTLRVFRLQPDGEYAESKDSPTFPGVPVGEIAGFVTPDPSVSYLSLVREFRQWVREQIERQEKPE